MIERSIFIFLQEGRVALHLSVYYGRLEVTRLLLSTPGVDIHAKDNVSLAVNVCVCWIKFQRLKLPCANSIRPPSTLCSEVAQRCTTL